MELVFVRHAQPRWGVDGRNVDDPDLTDLGWAQARAVAQRLAKASISRLYLSPTVRTRQTAQPIEETTGIVGEVVDDLREIEGPGLEGWPIEKVDELFATARHRSVDQWWDEGILNGEGELYRHFHDRVSRVMEDLLTGLGVRRAGDGHLWTIEDDPGRIVVVGHGGTNGTAIGHLLEAEPAPWSWERFMSFHASVTRIEAIPIAGEHVFGLRSFNELAHLGDLRQTR